MNIRYPIYEGVYRILTVEPDKEEATFNKVSEPVILFNQSGIFRLPKNFCAV